MMEQEDRDRLIRFDERTASLVDTFERHVKQDREDFKEVHHRINRLASKLYGVLGVGAAIGVGLTTGLAWIRSTITGGT